ncbi:MAG: Segregation and condensation protein B [Chlamydiae bacterium]|nr:Segregation and condensation protein B [Chlamydiota bacterium]
MEKTTSLKQILESLFFASNTPLSLKKLQSLIGEEHPLNKKQLKTLLEELGQEYQDRAFELTEIAGGYTLQSKPEFHTYIQKLYPSKQIKLSPSTLEVLSIIAYKQPITRAEIETIRGVDSSYPLSQLLERDLVTNKNKLDAPGQPSLYETTISFLEYFGLKNLKDLPPLPQDEPAAPIAPKKDLSPVDPHQ